MPTFFSSFMQNLMLGLNPGAEVKHYTSRVYLRVTRSPCGCFMDTPCWLTKKKTLPIQEKQEGFSRITFQFGVCLSPQSDYVGLCVTSVSQLKAIDLFANAVLIHDPNNLYVPFE